MKFTKYGDKLKSGDDYFVLNKRESSKSKLVFKKDETGKVNVPLSTRFYVYFETEIWLLICVLTIMAAIDNACVLCANSESSEEILKICSIVQYIEFTKANQSNMPDLIPVEWNIGNSSDRDYTVNEKP